MYDTPPLGTVSAEQNQQYEYCAMDQPVAELAVAPAAAASLEQGDIPVRAG